MKPGPSNTYRRLLAGKITSERYVSILRRHVRWSFAKRPVAELPVMRLRYEVVDSHGRMRALPKWLWRFFPAAHRRIIVRPRRGWHA